jgi:hypothetical protein
MRGLCGSVGRSRALALAAHEILFTLLHVVTPYINVKTGPVEVGKEVKVKKLGHENSLSARLRSARASLAFLRRNKISRDELLQCLRLIDYYLQAQKRHERDTAPLTRLLSNRKQLQRFADAVQRRGPKSRRTLNLVATRFSVSPEEISAIPQEEILSLHVGGLRRPKKEASLAVLTLADFFLTRALTPSYQHVAAILKAVFPARFAKLNEAAVKMVFAQKNSVGARIVTPAIFGSDRQARRMWLLAQARQWSFDALELEMENFRKRNSQEWKIEQQKLAQEKEIALKEADREKARSNRIRRANEAAARKAVERDEKEAWECFSTFAKRAWRSGEQTQIEAIVKNLAAGAMKNTGMLNGRWRGLAIRIHGARLFSR